MSVCHSWLVNQKYLVPSNDGPEDASIELFELAGLVLGTLVVRLGHVEVPLRIANAL